MVETRKAKPWQTPQILEDAGAQTTHASTEPRVPSATRAASDPQGPLWLLCELTYRCPLACAYCSNPLNYADYSDCELATADWLRVLEQARKLGAVQLGWSGGEPLLRRDLAELVRRARDLGFYQNLITSGVGLSERRLDELCEAGLDHVQLSFQSDQPDAAREIAGPDFFEQKLAAARLVNARGLPFVANIVLHRRNIGRTAELIRFAYSLGADYLELASAQLDGWAYTNRAALLPTRAQVDSALAAARAWQTQQAIRPVQEHRMQVFFVAPDYHEDRPKACGRGWASTLLAIAPDGRALPCHGAAKLPLSFPRITEHDLAWIWRESSAFQKFRGFAWMPEPCRSCEERFEDFGGCRCQAFLLTGDASVTDPACSKAPQREIIEQALADTERSSEPAPLQLRNPRIHA